MSDFNPLSRSDQRTTPSLFILILLGISLFYTLSGCTQKESVDSLKISSQEIQLQSNQYKVIYGDDSRRDYYEVSDEHPLKSLMHDSTVMLVRPNRVSLTEDDRVTFDAPTLGVKKTLCSGQRFYTQPAPGFCSGTLIDSNLVLTAGHCVDDQADCQNTQLVFNYHYSAAGELNSLTSSDLYSCTDVVVRRNDAQGDYAIIRLCFYVIMLLCYYAMEVCPLDSHAS